MVKLVPNTKSKVKTESNTEVNEQDQGIENRENKEEEEEKDSAYSPEVKDVETDIDFPYNKRTLESYRKADLKPPEDLYYQETQFLSIVNVKKGPIERVVTRMVRLKARDYSIGNHVATKEYLVYYENWYGKNWIGQDIPPVADHVEGMYLEQEKRTVMQTDYRTGRTTVSYKRGTEHPVYYIPFSKEAVDDILKDTFDKDSIIFTIKFTPPYPGGVRSNFSYEQFRNMSFDEAFRKNAEPGGPVGKPLSANGLSFQPS